MIKLSQQQIAILESASTHPDSFAIRPANLKPAAAAKAAAKLIEHGLARELRVKGDAPIWREDEGGKRFSLKLLKAGLAAVQALRLKSSAGEGLVSDKETQAGHASTAAATKGKGRSASVGLSLGRSSADQDPVGEDATGTIKGQTKRALILGLMGRDGGATLHELIVATGWLPHTTRAALTGLRKSGIQLERTKLGDVSSYQVIAASPATRAAI